MVSLFKLYFTSLSIFPKVLKVLPLLPSRCTSEMTVKSRSAFYIVNVSASAAEKSSAPQQYEKRKEYSDYFSQQSNDKHINSSVHLFCSISFYQFGIKLSITKLFKT